MSKYTYLYDEESRGGIPKNSITPNNRDKNLVDEQTQKIQKVPEF